MPALSPSKSNAPFSDRFPFDIEKRILFHALALPPFYPSKEVTDAEFTTLALAAQTGRARKAGRIKARLETQRAALSCMTVCKAWKGEATKYLYIEPYLTSDNLYAFSRTLRRGDKRWSDINIHPASTPGRWVRTLDLTCLHQGEATLHSTILAKSCATVFPLIPNLQHLSLPAGLSASTLHDISEAAFASKLVSLLGLEVDYEWQQDPEGRPTSSASELLLSMPNLELLGLCGPGNILAEAQPLDVGNLIPHLSLRRLHTLLLQGVLTGPVLASLIETDLPSLTRLHITSFWQYPSDLTETFQQTHGSSVKCLSYMPIRQTERPSTSPEPTFVWHPNVTHIGFATACCEILTQGPQTGLSHLRLSKPGPAGNETGDTEAVLACLSKAKSHGISLITMDGLRWVKLNLGEKAMSTGYSGQMRVWAEKLRAVGITMLDMDGRSYPSTFIAGVGHGLGPFRDGSRRRRPSEGQGTRVRPEKLYEDGA
ncbi:hypothetical protein BD324DRAFT_367653 [Kockovaella imperatae]|uniref:Uncharacterized protein n=1 Tax=Kockovaella imperatae TaxID=4999 RepID=A0A1Y1UKQ9_9TREE|nr:hypothetical protein BD324DRAFT_367653 [Kockovaella imperatae]ORX38579.1 hypothetical protein BD324DRAFT_367653 [Kockovaella imperatae]